MFITTAALRKRTYIPAAFVELRPASYTPFCDSRDVREDPSWLQALTNRSGGSASLRAGLHAQLTRHDLFPPLTIIGKAQGQAWRCHHRAVLVLRLHPHDMLPHRKSAWESKRHEVKADNQALVRSGSYTTCIDVPTASTSCAGLRVPLLSNPARSSSQSSASSTLTRSLRALIYRFEHGLEERL